MTLDMAYDSNRGGITWKSDVGTLLYDYPGKPYAVSGIDTAGVGLVIPEYAQEISYTSFESVSTISENDYLATFTYNSDNQRAKMVVQQNGNFINMNGRVYDPLPGQFLSPDNYVQTPDFTQNFKRYGYCLNNPLIYTDPSGEFIFTALAVLTGQLWALPITIGADFGAVTGGIRGAQDPDVGF